MKKKRTDNLNEKCSFLQGANIRVGESNQLWCLDVIPLRQGALFLFGVGTMTGGVELGLGEDMGYWCESAKCFAAYLDLRNNISTSPAAFNSIFMLNNRPTVSIFRVSERVEDGSSSLFLISHSTSHRSLVVFIFWWPVRRWGRRQWFTLMESVYYITSAFRYHSRHSILKGTYRIPDRIPTRFIPWKISSSLL